MPNSANGQQVVKYLMMRNIFSSDPAHYFSPGVLLTEGSRGVQVVPRALIGPRSLIEKQNQLDLCCAVMVNKQEHYKMSISPANLNIPPISSCHTNGPARAQLQESCLDTKR